ncbi:peptidoglycan glycosyltransferase [Aureimonas endophytica]|uniref:Peptidoglycan glycosyltransferase n=1 Tax=Aureimonas endophytica TaxID=2027858 RepID=A0A916ZZQ1_9HYPH|nr:penicillin-binding protein 2 [Aureimonas endophytica]GGE20303.1 peptidoglycan glycosyltransferase [Aureimonas endophytica]
MRQRIAILGLLACYLAIGGRLVQFGAQPPEQAVAWPSPPSKARPDILDRNGVVLAMDLPSASIYAEPRKIVDLDEAVEGLTGVFPDLDPKALRRRLDSKAAFAWVRRTTTLAERDAVWALGIPGVGIRDELRRFYPNGRAAAHVLGAVNVDNIGIAGMEKWIDGQGLQALRLTGLETTRDGLEPVRLSLDLRAQHALADELGAAVEKFQAKAGAGLVMDIATGEVVALVSLPDFDPNVPADALKPDHINRVAVGTYEMGSTFKAMTTAMALDSGRFQIGSVIDASAPLRFGRFAIRDYRGQNRPLNVPESFIHSSNIAMGKMAMAIGSDHQRAFLRSLGQLDRLATELPESAQPLYPSRWAELNTATISFGHGIAVTPLQASMGIAAVVNDGRVLRPTFVKDAPLAERILAEGAVTPRTSEALRYLMRLNAKVGSAAKADIDGYHIGGKTGTSEKVVNGRYDSGTVLTAFMGIAPAHAPRYLFLTVLDEPKPLKETFGFRTSGWNAVPTTGRVMSRILPMLEGTAKWTAPADPFPAMAAARAWGSNLFRPRLAMTGERP